EPPSQSPPPSKEKPPPQEEKSGWETAGDVVAELSGYNDAKAAITGVDENGNKIGVGERVLLGARPSHPGRKSGQGWQICGPIRG
ncbi:pre-toxin TG domain-containing protein, partial [Paludifilum halophilum]